MQTIEAQFEIVTPMFISGANNEADLRPPSIKGALRFWWRALHWGQCLQDCQQDTGKALKRLHELEAELFGAAVKDDKYGQGIFSVKLKHIQNKGIESSWPVHGLQNAGYIAYGIDATKGDKRKGVPKKPHRKGLNPTTFDLTLILKKHITSSQKQQLEKTLLVWGLLGGLGARSRRGFGSVAIRKLDNRRFDFKEDSAYFNAIKTLLDSIVLAPEMPVFTAFNQAMKISSLLRAAKKYCDLMDILGNEYKRLRTLDEVSGTVLDRLACGLPLTGKHAKGKQYTESRRSSPVMLHVHKVGSNYIGLFSFIPAEFHPLHKQSGVLPLFKVIDKHLASSDKLENIYP